MPLAEKAGKSLVIVLDDSRTVLATVRVAFERLGLNVVTAQDASELVPDVLHRATLIVVDVQMEQVFGDDVVSFLRDSWQIKVPIYLYSSLPQEELDRRARTVGASGAVCKAAGIDALVARVRHLVEAA